MKKIIAAVMALTLGASAAMAGGPVVVAEEGQPEVMAEKPRSGWLLPVIVGAIIVCAIACGGNDNTEG